MLHITSDQGVEIKMDCKVETDNRHNKFKYTGAKHPYNADFWIVNWIN